jgi:hypothetical protein
MAPSLLPTKPKLKMKGGTLGFEVRERMRENGRVRDLREMGILMSLLCQVWYGVWRYIRPLAFVLSYCRKVSM